MNAIETDLSQLPRNSRKNVVLVVDSGESTAQEIARMVDRLPNFAARLAPVDALRKPGGVATPAVIVFDFGQIGEEQLEQIAAVRSNFEPVPVVVVSEALNDEQVRKLLKLKVSDWLRHPLHPEELLTALQVGVRQNKQIQNRVHAVISAVGGAGATSVAISLADILAQKAARQDQSVALFDLDFSTGSCGYYLNLRSNFALESALSQPSRIDSEFVRLLEQRHPAGFYVYSFRHRDTVTHLNCYELVLRLLDAVSFQHSHTVLDIPYYETDWRQDVLAAVNSVTIVSDITLPSINQTLEILKSLNGTPAADKQINILLNKQKSTLFGGGRFKTAKLKALFGETPFHFLPEDEADLADAMDRGILPSEVNSGGKFVKALRKFAQATLLAERVEVK